MNMEQLARMQKGKGFIAALDQSGGSTPKALELYGIGRNAYSSDKEMFDLVHAMRTRIVTSPSFTAEHILAAILFEDTMNRQIEDAYTADYLWDKKGIVPILKVDKGLAPEANDVQLMNDIPAFDKLLGSAVDHHIFGTKMRSVIKHANRQGIQAIVDQQFAYAEQISAFDLVPILEPEVSILSEDKADAEAMLKEEILDHLDSLPADAKLMLKVSIPSVDGFYTDVMQRKQVVRVVALSGGYSRSEANARLAKNPGLIASFSRALLQGLTAQQDDATFDRVLASSIQEIYKASVVK
ncbi:MAG: fructose bisphosphate aldolase [Atopobiaceae bacterium]|jgi:fructose-bisphosphate aldolase class I|nr:fructose bisphosphate aldolase [Atopobiaceae bacterium]